jgi:hypothetical protein
MTWNYFAAKWLNQFHHGWLTPLLCPRANVEDTDIAEWRHPNERA